MTQREEIEERLQAADEETRLEGLRRWPALGAEAGVPLLYQALGDDSWRVRKEAVELFLRLPAPGRLAGEIVELLHSQDNAGLRNAAVEILTRLGRQAVPELLEELDCSDHDVRKFALDILGEIGDPEAASAMIVALDDSDQNVRAAAAENLGKLRSPEAVPALIAALPEADLLLRFTILEALGQIGGQVPVEGLLALGEEKLVRKALFDCLGRVGGAEAVPILVEGLVDAMHNVRAAAALALQAIATHDEGQVAGAMHSLAGEAAAEALCELLQHSRLEVRRAAVTLLGWCGKGPHVLHLLELFEDDALREAAMQALSTVGRQVACSLTDLWPEADARRRTYLAYVFGEAGCAEGAPLLAAALVDPEPNLRLMAARALGQVGDGGDLKPLFAALGDEVEEVREAALQALCRIAPECRQDAFDALRPLLEDARPELRVAAVTLLGRLDGPEAGPLLNFALKDEAPAVRGAAVRAIEERPDEDQVPSLMLALTDEDADVRRLAAEALGASSDPAAVSALELALRDEDIWVRAATVRALGRLGGAAAGELVRQALGDAVGLVAIAALETLADLTPDHFYGHAVQALDHADEEVVNAAIKLLLACGCTDWIGQRAEALINHRHWEVRVNFARALAALGGESGRALLEQRLLVEGEDLVRQELQDLLTDLGGPR